MLSGADPIVMNFLEALIERHRMPVIFRIRSRYEEMWDAVNRLLPVEVTSAVPLDEQTVQSIGQRIGEQTGNEIELSTVVDPTCSAGSSSGWATSSSMPRSGTDSNNFASK